MKLIVEIEMDSLPSEDNTAPWDMVGDLLRELGRKFVLYDIPEFPHRFGNINGSTVGGVRLEPEFEKTAKHYFPGPEIESSSQLEIIQQLLGREFDGGMPQFGLEGRGEDESFFAWQRRAAQHLSTKRDAVVEAIRKKLEENA